MWRGRTFHPAYGGAAAFSQCAVHEGDGDKDALYRARLTLQYPEGGRGKPARCDRDGEREQTVDRRLLQLEMVEPAFKPGLLDEDRALVMAEHLSLTREENAQGVIAFRQVGGQGDPGREERGIVQLHRPLVEDIKPLLLANAHHRIDEGTRIGGHPGNADVVDRARDRDMVYSESLRNRVLTY